MFREADGGTLFLDEIGELPLATQVALLRVLQEEEVRPVGEAKSVAVDVRIIAATSRDLEAMVERGEFRADLYYRLNVLRIALPSLRERSADIAPLAEAILEGICRRLGRRVEPLEPEVVELLVSHSWPGNIRELENALERALILARGGRLAPGHFAFAAARATEPSAAEPAAQEADLSVKRQLRRLEEQLIRRALAATGGNRTRASRLLELSARALQYKLKEYGIDPLNPLSDGSDSSA
jgi:two-component system response regulator AtoC